MTHSEINSLIKILKEKKLTLALAESVTCGLAANKLSTCIGISEVFRGSVVCYSPEVKKSLMKVPEKMIREFSCESQEVTETLARNLKKLIQADIYGALTGLASEGGSESKNKPIGTVFLSVYYKNKIYNTKKLFRGTPSEIKLKACFALFELIKKKL
jgi:PncC family amidohydrolase